ncbi:MAG TPA: hypothetical protein VG942_04965 [Hyphomonadaceae bacterium]|nr:hypothetical protein [Hyphomonadaceae bacterium]
MILIPIAIGYGLFVAAVTAGLNRLFPRWTKTWLIVAATLSSALAVFVVGSAFFSLVYFGPPDTQGDLQGMVLAGLFYLTIFGSLAALPAGLLVSWPTVFVLRRRSSEPQPVEPIGGAEK